MLKKDSHIQRATISSDDLQLILTAVEAYSHNAAYRDMIARLRYQATMMGLDTSRAGSRIRR